ncbi:MAG: S-adenosyl-l-methionine hydroxide adenosyltransferase family protein [Candidatus Thermoplasmatota archaeon]|nr:S-adenosyl-l-methionine hydroxide adenosyltransferase family protein [Candidatus Thermoplasmatota archaeon]
MPLITLLSDFGPGKYVATMKGVILSINPEATLVDLDHDIPAQNVREGAFVLGAVVPYYPSAIHLAVVDPEVGGPRRPLVIEGEKGILVGPDNGLLLPAAATFGDFTAYELSNVEYRLPEVSHTFHGRDIFAPAAAHLSLGVEPSEMGKAVRSLVELDFGEYMVTEDVIRGEILFEDRFGNLITNVPQEALPSWTSLGGSYSLEASTIHEVPFVKSYTAHDPGKALLTLSSDGYLEIAVNWGNARETVGLGPGERFVVRKSSAKKS